VRIFPPLASRAAQSVADERLIIATAPRAVNLLAKPFEDIIVEANGDSGLPGRGSGGITGQTDAEKQQVVAELQ